jgi:anti-sigma factor RsiW
MSNDLTMIAAGDCGALEPWLSAWLDGEVFGEDRTRIERHVASCERCRAALDGHRLMGSAIRGVTQTAAARDLTAITWPPKPAPLPVRPVPALTPRRSLLYDVARWINPWPVFAGAAALVALILGIGLWRPSTPDALVEIERLDAAGPVMVLTANDGRTAIIWLSEPDESAPPEPNPI